MTTLKISDIREWLIDSRDEFQKLKAQEFPPLNNEVYWMYNCLYDFIEFYQFSHICHKALRELKPLLNCKFSEVVKWTQTYEVLGSQQLLMFEINYNNWNENVNEEFLKIHKELYTDRKPFAHLICFCKIFQLLYWENSIHETILTKQEQLSIHKELKQVFKKILL